MTSLIRIDSSGPVNLLRQHASALLPYVLLSCAILGLFSFVRRVFRTDRDLVRDKRRIVREARRRAELKYFRSLSFRQRWLYTVRREKELRERRKRRAVRMERARKARRALPWRERLRFDRKREMQRNLRIRREARDIRDSRRVVIRTISKRKRNVIHGGKVVPKRFAEMLYRQQHSPPRPFAPDSIEREVEYQRRNGSAAESWSDWSPGIRDAELDEIEAEIAAEEGRLT